MRDTVIYVYKLKDKFNGSRKRKRKLQTTRLNIKFSDATKSIKFMHAILQIVLTTSAAALAIVICKSQVFIIIFHGAILLFLQI